MSAVRSLRNLAASTSRSVLAQRTVSRSSSLARPVVTQWLSKAVAVGPSRLTTVRAFSVSSPAKGEGESDAGLSSKLAEELQYENEQAAQSPPDFIKDFQSQGVWTINDVYGNDEVALERSFGNEQIRVIFSIGDLDDANQEFEADPEQDEDAEQAIQSSPIRVSISIIKPSQAGAMNIDAVCQEGSFLVENVSFYRDSKVGTELTAEADWKRRGLYIGPTFENLDPGVQDEFERYLAERGINESLALFIPDYAEHKEQLEYVRWLKDVKSFIEA